MTISTARCYSLAMNIKERDIETYVEKILHNLGWIDDYHSPKRNVYKQQAKTVEQNKNLKRTFPDYVLYQNDSDQPLIVLEIKRPGQNLNKAMEQGAKYAKALDAPIVIVTDGVFVKTQYLRNNQPLMLNEEEIEELITQERALEFVSIGSNKLNTRSKKIISSRSELISIFEEANNLLRNEGIQAGLPRFSEFINILFLKLISELADLGESPHENIPTKYRWDYFHEYKGELLLDYINDTVLSFYQQKYNEDSLFEKLTIKNPITLEKIISKLDTLELVDINADIKGDAFEHFLKSYATGENDLGQYFTPRHIIKFMVKMINPNFGEKIFDPFCGTGGILIESYKHVKKSVANNPEFIEKLHKDTVFGSELTNTARITKMNMILMGDGHSNIHREDSLKNPKNKLYDIVITNQPFAQETEYGELYPVPSKLGNSICLQHSINAVKSGGRGALIVQEGVLFDRKYKTVRKWMFKNCKIKFVVSLPNGVFLPYTNAKTSIIIFEEKGQQTKLSDDIFFVDINEDGFTLNNRREKKNVKSDLEKLLEIRSDIELADQEFLQRNRIVKASFSEVKTSDYQLIGKRYKNKRHIESKYELVELQSMCKQIIRGPFGSDVKKSLYVDKGIKVYTQGNVINNDFNLGDYYVTEEYFTEKLSKFEIHHKDILMTCAGTLGKIALVPNDIARGIVNSVLTIFRVDETKVIPEYFAILLKSEHIQKELLDAMGTGVKNMRPLSEIKKLLVPLPNKIEQERIIQEYKKIEHEIASRLEELNRMKALRDGFMIG
ncbi:N-6 DNA methylase [Enterococcus faecalis]|uniref:N-6 DNA methylase n=1 Tax=Enterococcus faecalis TaxID=1351 RepID=UPI002DBB5CFF|nr:N-6 DNA methylase [Enterococcus faecalis]MEB7954406.1 N-6 DNA methylase [Enterococcus faecalis]MEB7964559.1 N-6 DNA methylase [Enterococcus faecalis]